MNNASILPANKYRMQVASRLQQLPSLFNFRTFSPPWLPSRMALALGCNTVGEAEAWLSGEHEPSLERLQQIADLYSLSPDWLIHGERKPFRNSGEIDLTNIETAFPIMLGKNEAGDKPETIALVRALNDVGSLMVILFYPNYRFKMFSTRYHISGATGAGGKIDLKHVFLTIEALHRTTYKPYVAGYLIKKEEFDGIQNGEQHPATILMHNSSTWPHDIWDRGMLKPENNKGGYWDGWINDCLVIVNLIETDERCKAIKDDIRANKLPIMNGPFN